ncbi:hypothetical protein Tco_1023135 [Tanacetum coccineum]
MNTILSEEYVPRRAKDCIGINYRAGYKNLNNIDKLRTNTGDYEGKEVILFYYGLDIPTRQILDSRGAVPTKTAANAKKPSKKWLNTLKNGTMEHLEEEILRRLTDWLRYKHN